MEKETSEPEEVAKDENEEELQLEQRRSWIGNPMYMYHGFWCTQMFFQSTSSFMKNFKPHDSDIILTSIPKTGTTWMKSLLYTVVNRHRVPINQSPLLSNNPHTLISNLERVHYYNHPNPDLETMPPPRLFSTHLPHHLLPATSNCKIVYITRNPLDQFISEREFLLKGPKRPQHDPLPVDQSFDMFCTGVHMYGPFWDHILGYWKASRENPERVLFLKYEELKMDTVSNIGKIADFVGLPFSEEEMNRGCVEEIVDLCSFGKLKNLEINKTGSHPLGFSNTTFFRKGEIGDWRNHLTPAMAQRVKEIMDEKMSASGFNVDGYFHF